MFKITTTTKDLRRVSILVSMQILLRYTVSGSRELIGARFIRYSVSLRNATSQGLHPTKALK